MKHSCRHLIRLNGPRVLLVDQLGPYIAPIGRTKLAARHLPFRGKFHGSRVLRCPRLRAFDHLAEVAWSAADTDREGQSRLSSLVEVVFNFHAANIAEINS